MGNKLNFPKIIRAPRPNCVENQNRLRKMMDEGSPIEIGKMTQRAMAELLDCPKSAIKNNLLLCGTKNHRHLRNERVRLAERLLADLDF